MPGWRSQWRLVLLNSLTCGLEICVAAGISYVPPMLLEAGIEERYMTMVLGIGPVLGLLFIPLIGSASDRCTSSYGRRRPFIWLLSLGVILSLLIIPHADMLAALLAHGGRALQVGILIFGVGLLDFCGQVCFVPLEALLSDLYQDEDGYDQAFAMFSFMVSLGGCVGYLLPVLDWSRSLLSVYLGGQAKCLFSLLILIFIVSLVITMKVAKEPSRAGASAGGPAESGPLLESVGGPASVAAASVGGGAMEAPRCDRPSSCCRPSLFRWGPLLCALRTCWPVTPALYRSYCHVPLVMKRLFAAQLCSWMAVMCFVFFYTDFVGEGLYGGVPSALPGSPPRKRYDEGIRIGSLGLFLQCATSTFFSMIMSRLVRHFGSRWVYMSSMGSFTASALVICLSKNVVWVTVMASLTGYAYATLQTVPYTLTCYYHKEKEVYMPKKITKNIHKNGVAAKRDSAFLTPVDEEEGLIHKPGDHYRNTVFNADGYEYYPLSQNQNGSSHGGGDAEPDEAEWDYEKRGVGLDFAILEGALLLSQVFASLFMGTIVQYAQSVTAYIACSAVFGAVAIYLASRIVLDQKDLKS